MMFSVAQVNRSSLLVPGQVTKKQEVNGTNGKAASPVTDARTRAEHSTDSEQDEAGDTDDPGNSESFCNQSQSGPPFGVQSDGSGS